MSARETAHRGEAMQHCIDACQACHAACSDAAGTLIREGVGDRGRLLTTLLDCAQMCATALDLMLRGSELHSWTCDACAEICDVCAERCDEAGGALAACAETCRECSAACRKMTIGG